MNIQCLEKGFVNFFFSFLLDPIFEN
uniref:Uncharacterized protein n=1 Tax=Rhizophora mucronata TaxID=61149 RepID=A0A2P2J485_RHIMU